MTKQELEEKIKNGESVWCLYQSHKEIEEMYFSKENKYKFMEVKYIDGGTELCLVVNYDWYYPLKYLFKTKAEAEHYLHHANVSRTETLPFLTWEEFKEQKYIKFISADNIDCMLQLVDNGIKISLIANRVKYFEATEANFYKAYEECVRLFKGE